MTVNRETDQLTLDDLAFDEKGLIPCVVQDVSTGKVLMVAWMNRESVGLTMEQRTTWFWSRSRQRLWHKGEESGNTQELVDLRYDCDADCLLARVRPKGPACHTGAQTCFYRSFERPVEGIGVAEAPSFEPPMPRGGMTDHLGYYVVEQSPTRVRMEMRVTPELSQPVGFMHGGASLTLLESCASWASFLGCDLETQYSFGSHMDVHHVNPVCEGVLHGVAELDHVDDLGEKGRKEVWRVEATDDAGTVISTGTFTTRVVSKAYFDSLGKDAPAAR